MASGFSAATLEQRLTIGPIIPSCNSVIVYAYMAGSSVSEAALFIAGVVPGLVLTLGMMVIIHGVAKRRGYPLTGEPVAKAKNGLELRRSA